jgi:hypothetical protein
VPAQKRVRLCVHPFMFDPQARERAGLHLSTTTATTIVLIARVRVSRRMWLSVFPSFVSFFSSSTSESREGVASVDSRRGEAQIVVVVVDAVGAGCSSLP